MNVLMKLKRRIATIAYGPCGDGRPEILEAGELVMPVGGLDAQVVDAMSIAGLIRVNTCDLEPDAAGGAASSGDVTR